MGDYSTRQYQRDLFPRRIRRERMHWRPVYRAADGWGRHTFTVGVPFLWGITVSHEWCDEPEMIDEFGCEFPGCPALASTNGPYRRCLSHHEEFAREFWAELTA